MPAYSQIRFLPFVALAASSPAAEDNGDALPFHELAPFQTEAEWTDNSFNALSVKTGSFQAATPLEASPSLAVALDSAIGVRMQRRGANALEPNIHGLGADRIDVYWNGIHLPNASPTQTASALNALGPGAVDQVSVFPIISPVALGPLSAGARIELTSHPLLRRKDNTAGILYDFNRSLRQAWVAHGKASASAAYRVSVYGNKAGDYEGGNGAIVDADLESSGLAFSFSQQLNTVHQLNVSSVFQRTDLARNASLPLDTRATEFFAVSASHRYSYSGSDSFQITKFGFSRNRPKLDNRDRIGAPILVSAEADTVSLSAGTTRHTTLANEIRLQAGIDFIAEDRDATRFRHTANATLRDRLWPHIESENLGLFVQIASSRSPLLQWRGGARLDHRWTEAKATDAPAIPNGSVRDNYIKYNGPDTNSPAQTDTLGGINGELVWAPNADSTLALGGGVVRAAPSATQRYRAFVNALGGGFEVGNPSLTPEANAFVKAQFELTRERLDLRASLFAKRIHDFIIREKIAELGSNPVYGFRNTDVDFRGIDLAAVLRPLGKDANIALPLAFSITEGQERTDHSDLAEVPPWEGRIGVECADSEFWWKAQLRLSGSRSNPTPETVPIFRDVSACAILDLKAGFALGPHCRMELALANALDEASYQYLQPPVPAGPILPSSGTLAPGDRIPQPGRSLSLRLDCAF